MNEKINVLHIITKLKLGGACDNTLLTVEKHDKERFDVTLLSSDGEFSERARKIEDQGKRLIINNRLKVEISFFDDIYMFFYIIYLILKYKFDVIHTHGSKAGILGRIAGFILLKKVVHTVHSYPFHPFLSEKKYKFYVFLEKIAAMFSHRILTVAKLLIKEGLDNGISVKRRYQTVYSGIDFSKFDIKFNKEEKRKEIMNNPNKKLVGLIGRVFYQKGPQYFVEAVKKIVKKRDDIEFIFVGDGPMRDEIQNLINSYNLEKNLKILGWRNDIPEILKSLDVFALSSLYEGLGRAMTEAMYCKIPVVATNVNGVPEVLKNRKTGILVEPKDVDALADGIEFLIDNPDKADEYVKNAHKKVKFLFNSDRMVKQIEDVYLKLLKK